MERISKHISYLEATKSNTALRLGLENTPTPYQLSNMGVIADNIFEPLRKWVGGPIKINSFFRSEDLNKAIGGSSKSQHCDGRALDIDDTFFIYFCSFLFNLYVTGVIFRHIIHCGNKRDGNYPSNSVFQNILNLSLLPSCSRLKPALSEQDN